VKLPSQVVIFQGLGVVQEQLVEYMVIVAATCPSFPAIEEWADTSSTEIGIQLRTVAVLLINNVAPKVFQVQQGSYDTHSEQDSKMRELLDDLRIGVHTFVRVRTHTPGSTLLWPGPLGSRLLWSSLLWSESTLIQSTLIQSTLV
jgi:hypothetical protein